MKRNLTVSDNCSSEQINAALVAVETAPGVVKLAFDRLEHRISIEYDCLVNSYSKFVNLLTEKGVYQNKGIRLKLLSIWYDYLDTTAHDNSLAPPAPCCNKPPRGK